MTLICKEPPCPLCQASFVAKITGDTYSTQQVHAEAELESLCWCLVSLACFKRFSASVALFIGPAPVTQLNFFPGNIMAFTPCFFSFFFSTRETRLNDFVGRWDAYAMRRGGRTLCLKHIWSRWANSSTCLRYWMSWKIWSAAWRTTTQPTSGKWQGATGPGFLLPGYRPPRRWQQLLFFWQLSLQKQSLHVWDRLPWN